MKDSTLSPFRTALVAIDEAAAELAPMVTSTPYLHGREQHRQSIQRWFDRTKVSLHNNVCAAEASKFANVVFVNVGGTSAEDSYSKAKKLKAFLDALRKDIVAHPEAYDFTPTRPERDKWSTLAPLTMLAAGKSIGPPLAMPEKVTLAWLAHNVPMKLWGSIGVLILTALAAAFWFGVRAAQIPGLAKLLQAGL